MALLRSGMNLQNGATEGLSQSAAREGMNITSNTKLKSDRFQSSISTAGSAMGLAAAGAVEAKKRGWFDDGSSILNDIF